MLLAGKEPPLGAGAAFTEHPVDDTERFHVAGRDAEQQPGAGLVLDFDPPAGRGRRLVVAQPLDALLGKPFSVEALHFCSPGECWGSEIRRFPRELVRTPSDDIFKHHQRVGKPELFLWLLIGTKEPNLAKVGVEGSSPFARSRFSSMANYRIDDRPPFGGLVVCGPIRT